MMRVREKRIFDKKKKVILLLLLSCFLAGCSTSNSTKMKEADKKSVESTEADKKNEESTEADKGDVESAEALRDILKDSIYWSNATKIEKDGRDSSIEPFEKEGCLETELKIHLYYYEYGMKELDEPEKGLYDIVVTFPEKEELTYLTFDYTARGLSSGYGYGDDQFLPDDLEEDISSQELEKNEWFQKHYTYLGETSLTIKKAEAESYEVKNKFPAGEKEKIISAIQKATLEVYKDMDNIYIYIEDFWPGDKYLSGRVVNLNIEDKWDTPLYWIESKICYTGDTMKEFEEVHWLTRCSTSQPNYNPTIEQVKQWANEENEKVDVEKCILAYCIKDGEIRDLKQMDGENSGD